MSTVTVLMFLHVETKGELRRQWIWFIGFYNKKIRDAFVTDAYTMFDLTGFLMSVCAFLFSFTVKKRSRIVVLIVMNLVRESFMDLHANSIPTLRLVKHHSMSIFLNTSMFARTRYEHNTMGRENLRSVVWKDQPLR